MEHAQRASMKPVTVWRVGVLILILMEHAQRVGITDNIKQLITES